MKLKESKYLYLIIFVLMFAVSFLLSIFVEHTSGIHGRGDLLSPGPLSWEEIFKNIKLYIFVNLFGVSLIFFIILYPLRRKNKEEKIDNKYSKAQSRMINREKYSSLPEKYECRICGYKNDDFPWGEDGKSPNYQICPCCGVQFGVYDITPEEIQRYFEQWRIKGFNWNIKLKPANWILEEQIRNNYLSSTRKNG